MNVTIISQTGKLLDVENISVITVPTTEGMIQILPEHELLVSTLELGELRLDYLDGKSEKIALAGGYIEVNNNNVVILADYADMSVALVKEEIDIAIQKAESKIAGILPPAELIQLEKILRYERFKQGLISS